MNVAACEGGWRIGTVGGFRGVDNGTVGGFGGLDNGTDGTFGSLVEPTASDRRFRQR
jgi:hypothetical protein